LLTPASRAYILYQVFDYVHRCPEPVRFLKLYEDLEDLEAWPGFREYVINDPRFLVVGDTIDIATAGIHSSASSNEIISQTLDLLYIPMTDYTLNRLVKRLRPETTEDDPASRVFQKRDFFRPEIKHLAKTKWLTRGEILPVRPEWLISPESAAYTILEMKETKLSAADLSVTLAEHFGITGTDAYSLLAQNSNFLLLPDGSICLYDHVMDNIENHKSSINKDLKEINESVVEMPEQIIEFEVPDDLDVLVAELSRVSGKAVSTEEILGKLKINADDPDYVFIFRQITSFLGFSAEILPVGNNLWFAVDAIPPEVFYRIKKQVTTSHTSTHSSQPPKKSGFHFQRDSSTSVSIIAKEVDLQAGCLTGGQLNDLFPDYPMIQIYDWSGLDTAVWYNSETRSLFGLSNWFIEHNIEPGDTVSLINASGIISASIHKKTTGFTIRKAYSKENFIGEAKKSLFTAVSEHLADAGGKLEKNKLVKLLQKEDDRVEWSVIAPLFERYPLLCCDEKWCWIAERTKKGRYRLAAELEILEIIRDLPEHVRTNQEILYLLDLVTRQEKVTATEEKLLVAKIRNCSKEALHHLVLSHLRLVIRYLLNRPDCELLLNDFSDYFQEGVIGLIKAVEKYDPSRAKRLQHATGWYLKRAIDKANMRLSLIRFPDHFYYQIQKYCHKYYESEECGEDDESIEPFSDDVQLWSDFEWADWEQVFEEYEDGKVKPVWLGLSHQEENSEDIVIDRIIVQELLNHLTERENDVICRSYGFNCVEETYEQISVDYGVTRSRIQQIHAKALSKLRESLKNNHEML